MDWPVKGCRACLASICSLIDPAIMMNGLRQCGIAAPAVAMSYRKIWEGAAQALRVSVSNRVFHLWEQVQMLMRRDRYDRSIANRCVSEIHEPVQLLHRG